MGAFIILIIMLIYLACSSACRKAVADNDRWNFEEKMKRQKEEFDAFVRDYTDPELEKQVMQDSELRERVRKTIRDAGIYPSICGKDVTLIAMAEHGKIPEKLTWDALYAGSNEKTIQFVRYYNQVLKQHGMRYDIQCYIEGVNGAEYRSIYAEGVEHLWCGFTWLPVGRHRMVMGIYNVI